MGLDNGHWQRQWISTVVNREWWWLCDSVWGNPETKERSGRTQRHLSGCRPSRPSTRRTSKSDHPRPGTPKCTPTSSTESLPIWSQKNFLTPKTSLWWRLALLYPLTVAQLIAHQQLQVLRRAIHTQNWQQPPPYSSQAAASLKCVQKR